MSHTLFISDLHLSDARPALARTLLRFLGREAPAASHLWILGDLFDFWVGDDARDEGVNAEVTQALRALVETGTPVSVMCGNRDFLLGEGFAAAAGARLVADPWVGDLHGTRTLLLHGDTLCTDDVDYQAFRRHVRQPAVQAAFLAQPVEARRRQVGQTRALTDQAKRAKTEAIMDVTPAAVTEALRNSGAVRMIHGHTHRPARHTHPVDGRACERWVLSDWDTGPECLRVDVDGCRRVPLTPG